MSRSTAVRTGRHAFLLALLASAAPALAQDDDPPPTPAETPADPPATAGTPAAPQAARSYTPADLVRFNPRNALDMLNQVPGFSIETSDTERRGLGQATGNVLVNGERLTVKSTDIFTELRQISIANVTRIEIVDGATLNISGLTGQVANIITTNQGLSGNFVYRPQIRALRTEARLLNGEISINGSLDRATQFSLSFRNDSFRNGNAGPEIVTTPAGVVLDRRDETLYVYGDQPRLSGTIRRNFGDGSVLNANAAVQYYTIDVDEISLRSGPGQPDRDRRLHEQEREWNYELGGDYEFGLGGGRLKLIGLRRFEHSPFSQTLIQSFADGSPTQGQRFTQVADETETILRGEYRWRGGNADWQVSARRRAQPARHRERPVRAQRGGRFRYRALPQQRRDRRGAAGRGDPDLRPAALAEPHPAGRGRRRIFELSQSGAGGLTRTFYRPKGFLNLAWRPAPGARHQRPDRARRRPAQLLRFRRLGQCQRRHPECRQRQSGAAAKLERAAPGDPQPRPLGHRDGAALRPADQRHRRRHPDRRDRPVAGQSRRHRHASTACNGPAPSTSIRSAGAAPRST